MRSTACARSTPGPTTTPGPLLAARAAGVAGGLGVAIGDADDGGFLQAECVVDIVRPVAQERQFGRAGIAEDLADSELPHQIKRRLFDADGFHVCFWLFTRQGELSP